MKKNRIILIFVVIFLHFPGTGLHSGTTIDSSGMLDVSGIGVDSIVNLIQNSVDYLGPGVAEGFALANLGGYPFGTSYIGALPHFFIGASLSVGLTNMQYFDNDIPRQDGEYPAGGINPTVYLGLGIAGGFDIMLKLMVYNDQMYRPPLNYSYAALSKLNLYSIGGKLRYNLVKKATFLPGLLGFGGVNISAGADFLYGKVKIEGDFTYSMADIDTGSSGIVAIDFDPSYTAEVGWYIISGNTQIIAYLDFLWIFSLYSGFGLSLNAGNFSLDVNGSGALTSSDPAYVGGGLGSMSLVSENKYKPKIFLPVYILGFDIAISYIHITIETMVNIRNRTDVNVQFGTRIQI